MNKLIKAVKELFPDLGGLKETKVTNLQNEIVGYNSIFYLQDGHPIGGGTAENAATARRIAVAEVLERGFYSKLRLDPALRQSFLLNKIDSTLGFACGFESEKTAYRSYCEALEKWALSKVIDEKLQIEVVSPDSYSQLSQSFLSVFKEIFFFQRSFNVFLPFSDQPVHLMFVLFVGCTEDGAFPGSHVVSCLDDRFTHAIIEGWRNYQNFIKNDGEGEDLLQQRINYFGRNKAEALRQVRGSVTDWPQPQVELFKEYKCGISDVYLFRTLIRDFIPVSEGDLKRFVI